VAEALWLVKKSGVDPGLARHALLGGLAASKVLDVAGQRMLAGDHEPGFRLALQLKDSRIIRDLADQVDLPTPAHDAVYVCLESLVKSGYGDLDHSAFFRQYHATNDAAS
jgi:2-hydroxy-3-oxopropionate reductase